MKTKKITLLLGLLTWFAFGEAWGQVPVTNAGQMPPHLIKITSGKFGQMLGIKDYGDGDSLFGLIPVYYLEDSILKIGSYTVLHTGNVSTLETDPTVPAYAKTLTAKTVILSDLLTIDGSGSGLDADLLDGQSGAYYLALANATGTLAVANGGTGLSALGTASQLLRVNAGATALEYFTPSYLTSVSVNARLSGNGTSGSPLDIAQQGATSNQVLTWNGSAWAPATPTGGISGSGTADQVTYWSSTSALTGTTGYTFESGLGRLKVPGDINVSKSTNGILRGLSAVNSNIGTAAQAMFEIGNGSNTLYVVQNGANFTPTGAMEANGALIGQDAGKLTFASNTFKWFNTTGSSEYMRLTSTGLGIGVTAAEKLDVTGNILLTGVIKNADGAAATPAYTFTNDLDVGMWRPTTNSLAFSTLGTERVRIDASGNVGIGTTTPVGILNTQAFSAVSVSGLSNSKFAGLFTSAYIASTIGTTYLADYTLVGATGYAWEPNGGGAGYSSIGVLGVGGAYAGASAIGGKFYGVANNNMVSYAVWAKAVSYTGNSGYGVYIDDGTGAGTNWGLYQSSADDTNYFAGKVGIGGAPSSWLTLAGNMSASAWGLNGIHLQAAAATFTDNSTAASGTATNVVANSFGIPTFAATNTGVTGTNCANVYIAGAGTDGTNFTGTNKLALFVDDGGGGGLVRFDGAIREAQGSAATPSYSFTSATDYGMYQGSSALKFATGGTERVAMKSTGQVQFLNYTSATSFTGTAAGMLGFDASGNLLSKTARDTVYISLTAVELTVSLGAAGTQAVGEYGNAAFVIPTALNGYTVASANYAVRTAGVDSGADTQTIGLKVLNTTNGNVASNAMSVLFGNGDVRKSDTSGAFSVLTNYMIVPMTNGGSLDTAPIGLTVTLMFVK